MHFICYLNFPANFKWDITCINKFQNQLFNQSSAKYIKSLSFKINSRTYINTYVKGLSNIILNVAEMSLSNKNIYTNTNKNDTKWFHNQLKYLRKTVLSNANAFHRYPYNTEISKVYFQTLRKYNNLRKQQSRQFRAKLIEQINYLTISNPLHYYNSLNKLRANFTDHKATKINMVQ